MGKDEEMSDSVCNDLHFDNHNDFLKITLVWFGEEAFSAKHDFLLPKAFVNMERFQACYSFLVIPTINYCFYEKQYTFWVLLTDW